jgi:hypothetical protein
MLLAIIASSFGMYICIADLFYFMYLQWIGGAWSATIVFSSNGPDFLVFRTGIPGISNPHGISLTIEVTGTFPRTHFDSKPSRFPVWVKAIKAHFILQ